MFFLLRVAFWLGVVLLLLPSGGSQHNKPSADIGASDAISAASATVHDLKGFCTREPSACSVGSQFAIAMGYRAQAGAKMLYDFLTEALAPNDTGSVRGRTPAAGGKAPLLRASSQDTLTPADLAPAWRGPAADKRSRHPA